MAGVAALGVVFFPTSRPDLTDASARCGETPVAPTGCTALQHTLGKTTAAAIHFASAVLFIALLGALCFLFARREADHAHNVGLSRLLRACGWAIFGALLVAAVGTAGDVTLGVLTPL